jgi:hypothetical protein
MVKFYVFSAGSKLPSWMISIMNHNRVGYFNNRAGKAVFGTSCVVSRYLGGYKVMPSGNSYTEKGGIFISCLSNATVNLKGAVVPSEDQKVSDLPVGGDLNE